MRTQDYQAPKVGRLSTFQQSDYPFEEIQPYEEIGESQDEGNIINERHANQLARRENITTNRQPLHGHFPLSLKLMLAGSRRKRWNCIQDLDYKNFLEQSINEYEADQVMIVPPNRMNKHQLIHERLHTFELLL